jgi:hypothetical protein
MKRGREEKVGRRKKGKGGRRIEEIKIGGDEKLRMGEIAEKGKKGRKRTRLSIVGGSVHSEDVGHHAVNLHAADQPSKENFLQNLRVKFFQRRRSQNELAEAQFPSPRLLLQQILHFPDRLELVPRDHHCVLQTRDV